MTTKKISQEPKNPALRVVCYLLSAVIILGTVFLGSKNKLGSKNGAPIMLAISDSNYSVSVDQLSELYIVAEVANNVSLSSSSYLNMDYISAATQYSLNQTASTKIEKTNIVDTSSLAKGVIEYEVADGETMETIANEFGLSTDQIRWSNGKKTTDVTVGETLYLPSVPGIVYTVKGSESVAEIVGKYGSTADRVTDENNLASRGLSEGLKIVIPDGSLPETERPEYVAPAPVRSTYVATSTYTPSTALYSTSSNPMPWGWCTWYAWQWRFDNGNPLPGGLGNARYWASQLAARGYSTGSTPAYGAVFVDYRGYYGHVGIVTSNVNDDGTIQITDMNGQSGWGRIGTRTVEASEWGSWTFVY